MRLLLLLCFWFTAVVLPAQTALNFFKPVEESAIALPETAERKLIPLQYDTYRLDYAAIKTALEAAPMEFTEAARSQTFTLLLPTAAGALEEFAVWETQLMEPALAAAAPYVRTFAGRSLKDSRKTIHLSHTLRGFRCMILLPDYGVEYIEPIAWGQDKYYMVYDAHQLPPDAQPVMHCDLKVDNAQFEAPQEIYTPPVESRGTQLDPVTLRIYRLIVSTTGEYSQDHGSTPQEVFSAIAEHVNQINAVYERDLAIRFNLIQATLAVIFMDPTTDPFTGGDPAGWAAANQDALNSAGIPSTIYDIGHVFARGGGGVSLGLGNVCLPGKFGGATAGSGSYGHGFIFVACQEMGHQFGGGHTWNRCGGGALGQREGISAFEPGSGSTILSYCGICGPDNIQGQADLYFHPGSIEIIGKYIEPGPGGNCGTEVVTTNTPPVVSLSYSDNFFIPIQTPFELNGQAEDADGDVLSYSWEEMDLGPEVPLGTQTASSPIFRSNPSVSATNRYFPKLSSIINGTSDIRELLPEYTRDLTFRFTAFDHFPNGGGVSWTDVAFKAWGDAGPFVVQSPNATTDKWNIGEYAEVRWDVANTDKAPVSCARVNIRLSTDGGQTYPITLASNVANDGSHYVLVPDIPTFSARVRVDAAQSVFFDISDKNFRILQPAAPSFTMGLDNDSGVLCLPAEHEVSIHTAGVQGFSEPAELSLVGSLPTNVTANFSNTTLQPGESATLTLDFSQVDVEETFTITIQAMVAGSAPILRDIVLTTLRNDFTALALNLPADGATELQLTQTLHWTKGLDALTYDAEVATDPSFDPATIVATVSGTTLDSFKMPVLLAKGAAYYWRVRPVNECGTHDWTEPFFFSTFAEKCVEWEANDLPKVLTANGTPKVESKITVNAGSVIKNIEVRQLSGYHEFFRDLDVHLISPAGTDVTLWTGKCGNFNGSFNLRLTDEAPADFQCPPPNNGAPYRPQTPLSTLIGENSTGPWILRVNDTEYGGGGTISQFRLEFCSEVVVNPPYLVNNNTLFLDPGNNKVIPADLLLVEDANNTHSQLQYTLVTVPQHGHLALNWGTPLQPGDQFAQSDIDNGSLRFFDYGSHGLDGFKFTVTDGEGGFFGTPRFMIQTATVGTEDLQAPAFDFQLFPNPAQTSVWIGLDRPATEDMAVAVYNSTGQQIRDARLDRGAERLLLQTTSWPAGIYFVQVQGKVRKLIVRH
ncbi:MAG: T9SS type A sorting domain-containing protein [Bacteroidetes bacterium]|nr:MAG: T9SS type A sorting domain-containing protein [Bacteroidota bacterium]